MQPMNEHLIALKQALKNNPDLNHSKIWQEIIGMDPSLTADQISNAIRHMRHNKDNDAIVNCFGNWIAGYFQRFDTVSHHLLGVMLEVVYACVDIGDYSQAAHCIEILRENTSDPTEYYGIATEVYTHLGNFEKIAEHMIEAIGYMHEQVAEQEDAHNDDELMDNIIRATYTASVAYFRAGNYKKAIFYAEDYIATANEYEFEIDQNIHNLLVEAKARLANPQPISGAEPVSDLTPPAPSA